MNKYYATTRYPGDFPEGFSWQNVEEGFAAALRIKEFVLGKIKQENKNSPKGLAPIVIVLIVLVLVGIIGGGVYLKFKNPKSKTQIIGSGGGGIVFSEKVTVSFDSGILKDGILVKVSQISSPSIVLFNTEKLLSSVIRVTFPSSALQDQNVELLQDAKAKLQSFLKGVTIKMPASISKDNCTTIRTTVNNIKLYAKYKEDNSSVSVLISSTYLKELKSTSPETEIESLISTIYGCPS